MSSQSFRFKQFEVFHDKCAMKVGTDGVLLGAWTAKMFGHCDATDILDIGTGSGLIALMTAQRFADAHIIGIDIDTAAVNQANENFLRSPWSNRLEAQLCDFSAFKPDRKFDIATCNPPFFRDSLKNPDLQRAKARHNDSLPYNILINQTIDNLLKDNGILCIIIPYSEEKAILQIATEHQVTHICHIRTYPGKDFKRSIIAISHKDLKHLTDSSFNIQYSELTLETIDHQRSEEYINLTKEYYL